MNFKQMRYFVAVVDEGSFSKAARVVRVAQPALSQQILNLEKSLSTTLLERTPAGVTPTASGEAFLHHARHILGYVDWAKNDILNSGAALRGEVSIALPVTLSNVLTPKLLRLSQTLHPELTLRFIERNSSYCETLIKNSRVDLAIIPSFEANSKIDQLYLFDQDIYFVGAVDNICGVEETAKDITFREACSYPLVVVKKPHGLHLFLEKTAEDEGITLRFKHHCDSSSIGRHHIWSGIAFSFLAELSFQEKLLTKSVFARKVIEPELSRTYCIAWSRARPRNLATIAICDMIEEICAEIFR